ncbi:MAG TPA: GxxExxY protein [Terriglobales bacterium]|nr:GxxExxY protein [Terriglobales bacterium]
MHPVRSVQWPQQSHQTNSNILTEKIIGAAIRIHRRLGPGLLESAYETCLAFELHEMGLRVEQQKAVPLIYGTAKLECGFRADLVVEGRVVVELKCKEALHPVDHAQVLSHLRLLGLQVGLLINFHVVVLKDGVRRIVNHYDENLESQSAQRKSAEDAEKT